jgi:hypothetical protein
MSICKQEHLCHCGLGAGTTHEVGSLGCANVMADTPKELPLDMWHVDGVMITGYTLREQRGYCKHACGCWSRGAYNANSIEEDD